jgi:hypothetical protein
MVIVDFAPKKLDLAATKWIRPAKILCAFQQEMAARGISVWLPAMTGKWVPAISGQSLDPMKRAYQQTYSILARPFIQTILEDVVNPVLLVVVVFHIVAHRTRTNTL